MQSHNAQYWVQHLHLQPHPEGGHFRETYTAKLVIPKEGLPHKFESEHVASTAIYYLLEGNQFSAFHKIKSDELWHFYSGSTLLVHSINKTGEISTLKLGSNPERGEVFQGVAYAGTWFAAQLEDSNPQNYALVGCTVSPGFDFHDFEIASPVKLAHQYPEHSEIINKLTR